MRAFLFKKSCIFVISVMLIWTKYYLQNQGKTDNLKVIGFFIPFN